MSPSYCDKLRLAALEPQSFAGLFTEFRLIQTANFGTSEKWQFIRMANAELQRRVALMEHSFLILYRCPSYQYSAASCQASAAVA
jgi:hypothetical protein